MSAEPEEASTRKRILVVEDEPSVAQMLKMRLTKEGYDVAVAMDGLQGPIQVRTFKPHLVLLDIMMPAGGGIAVLRTVRMSAHSSAIPVIVLTAGAKEEHRRQVEELGGVNAYMQKPYNPHELMAEIRKALGEKEPNAEQ